MDCRVDLLREGFRGVVIGVGAVLLITGPFFGLLSPWLGPALAASGAVLVFWGLRLPTRWCLSEGRLCLMRRCFDLARLKGYEVREVGLGFCREKRLYLVFEDKKVPFPTAVEGAERLARELFGEVPEILRPPKQGIEQEIEFGKPDWWHDIEHVLVFAVGYFVVGLVVRVAESAGWGVAIVLMAGLVVLGVQLVCLYERLRAPR